MSNARVALSVVEGLPKLLNKRRRELQVSLQHLSQEIGVSPGTLSRVELGAEYTATTLLAILRWIESTENSRPNEPKPVGRPIGVTKYYAQNRGKQ